MLHLRPATDVQRWHIVMMSRILRFWFRIRNPNRDKPVQEKTRQVLLDSRTGVCSLCPNKLGEGCVYSIHRTQINTHQLGDEAACQCSANQSKVSFYNLYCDH